MTAVKIFFSAIVVLYPVIVYFSLDYFEPRLIASGLIVIALVRLFIVGRVKYLKSDKPQAYLMVAALLVVGVTAAASNSEELLQYYPVYLSVLMFALFSYSLIHPPTIVEQIARLGEQTFPDAAVIYTRKVTMVWCVFFAFNAVVSLWSIVAGNLAFWTIYNGFVSYCLMGLLFAGEYIARRRARRAAAPGQDGRSWVE